MSISSACQSLMSKRLTMSLTIKSWKSRAVSYSSVYSKSLSSVQFSPVTQLCPTLCNPMDCSMPGLPVHHRLLKFTQTHVNWVGDAIQPSHALPSPSPPTFSLCQHQGLFQWVSSSHQVAKVSEFPLQHQSFQWKLATVSEEKKWKWLKCTVI